MTRLTHEREKEFRDHWSHAYDELFEEIDALRDGIQKVLDQPWTRVTMEMHDGEAFQFVTPTLEPYNFFKLNRLGLDNCSYKEDHGPNHAKEALRELLK